MRCSTVVAVIIGSALAVEASACDAWPVHSRADLAAQPAALRIFWGLLQQARLGFSQIEHTAFIVRDAAGSITSVPWPDAGEANVGRWMGAFPANVVAIVHTHPNWLPTPSHIDAHTALRTSLPVYVITRAHISKTQNGSTTMVMDGDWKPGVVCDAAGASDRNLAEATTWIADAARRTGRSRRWSWSRRQPGPGGTAADHND